MTEAEWLACTEPQHFFYALEFEPVSNRKLRLFACACCRLLWHLLTDERSQKAVEVAERFADGVAPLRELEVAYQSAVEADKATRSRLGRLSAEALAAKAATYAASHEMNVWIADGARDSAGEAMTFSRHARASEENRIFCRYLIDLFGPLPFRLVALAPAWLAWNDNAVVKVAQAIYDDRTFDRLPILADALEDAGCPDLDLLAHCRQPGEHVRGCWVVDLLLSKT
jgi:hypothetical protein